MASANLNRPPAPMRIGNRNVCFGDNEALRSVLAAYRVRQIIAKRNGSK